MVVTASSNFAFKSFGQTAADRDMVTIDITLSNGTVAAVYSHNTCVTDRQTTDKQHMVHKARSAGRPVKL